METNKYELRSLQQDEIPTLLDHLDAVFGAANALTGLRGAPRGFFEHHWDSDETRDPRGCFCAFVGDGEMAASVRVYSRSVRIGARGTSVAIGGIGDVATKPEHRGKRLASRLLGQADVFMADTAKFNLAVLHAGPGVIPVYAKQGWASCPFNSTALSVDTLLLAKDVDNQSTIQAMDLTNSAHLSAIKATYALTAPSILGSFERPSDFYWTQYVGTCHDPRRVKTRIVYSQATVNLANLQVGECIGYAYCEAMRHDIARAISAYESSGVVHNPINILVMDLFAGKVATVADDIMHMNPQTPSQLRKTLATLLSSSLSNIIGPFLPGHIPLQAIQVKFIFPSALLPSEVFEAMSATDMDSSWTASEYREKILDEGFMFKVLHPFTAAVGNEGGKDIEVSSVEELKRIFAPVAAGRSIPFAMCEGVFLGEGADVFGFFKSDRF
ncbi:acyl-CoA N-acyltransferase [Chytriomyces sp. MP71]|nr:acyl-CoA N-acyltransferase [Chytriomyces sp. MP71]